MAHHSSDKRKDFLGLLIGCVGVVYGDIGTSPLYALRESFNPEIGLPMSEASILGVLSLLLWSLIIVVSIKYVNFVMKNDNKGEGGILALMALAQRAFKKRTVVITTLGLFGAALFYGDGMITPAISVISAVEGLKIATPTFTPYIVPITLFILVLLFSIQSHGTELISKFFGPITALYFGVIALLGVMQIIDNPYVLNAWNPYYALMIFVENHWIGFLLMGSVVLAVTGAEALYADMGHFGRKPIQLAWTWYVLPCLVLNYLGQGALLLSNPEAIKDPFYLLVPKWALYPMVALVTCATVIASQAMISGVFSVTQQAIQLGFMPRLAILHTSHKHMGQIYLPKLNTCLAIGVMILVVTFQSSTNMASAYGIAVTGTMLMTSLLSFVIVRYKWKKSLIKTCLIVSPLVFIDFVLFSATLMKLFHSVGAWVPLLVGVAIFTLMMTWKQGRELVRQHLHRKDKLTNFLKETNFDELVRVSGTAIYMVRNRDYAPHALVSNIKYSKVMHENVLLVSVQTDDVPRVPEKDRLEIAELGNGIFLVTISYGFMQQPHIPRALAHLKYDGMTEEALKDAPYYLSRERIVATPGRGMWLWRERLYAIMQRNAADASAFFALPEHHVVEIGTPVKI